MPLAHQVRYRSAGPMTASLVGANGFAAIPTTAIDLPLLQRLQRSPRFGVRVPITVLFRHDSRRDAKRI